MVWAHDKLIGCSFLESVQEHLCTCAGVCQILAPSVCWLMGNSIANITIVHWWGIIPFLKDHMWLIRSCLTKKHLLFTTTRHYQEVIWGNLASLLNIFNLWWSAKALKHVRTFSVVRIHAHMASTPCNREGFIFAWYDKVVWHSTDIYLGERKEDFISAFFKTFCSSLDPGLSTGYSVIRSISLDDKETIFHVTTRFDGRPSHKAGISCAFCSGYLRLTIIIILSLKGYFWCF